jgi:hypothetical protein
LSAKVVRALVTVALAALLIAVGTIIYLHYNPPLSSMATSPAAGCIAYRAAQEIYHRKDYDGDGVLEYAQSLHELYETKVGAGDLKFVDQRFANYEGPPGIATPKAGYVCKVLEGQGEHAAGGKMSYLDESGRMTRGFAFVMCPGAYDGTGRDMFMINKDSRIFQKDCGPDTPAIFAAMTEFDPDSTWIAAE